MSQIPVRFRVIARTDEPLICARRAEAGNQFETLSFIPSSTLLGAFAARVTDRWNLDNSSIYQDFVRLFRRGFVQFPFLYPAYFDKDLNWLYPAIPAPLDLLTCKIYPGFVPKGHTDIERHGVFPGTTMNLSSCPKCKEKNNRMDVPLESLGGFVALRNNPRHFSVPRHSEMHPRINLQTKCVGDEGLFGYTVLSEGQYFVGEMAFHNEQAFQTFAQLTGLPAEGETFTLRLGKASRRGYGQTTFLFQRLEEDAHELWIGRSIEDRVQDASNLMIMTTLTDTILSDHLGRSTSEAITRVLPAQFGEVTAEFVKTRQISPFNTHLGLPRKQETAIVAGSAFLCLFDGLKLLKLHECLKTLERQGIGERRWEGFGRIAFNHPVYEECQTLNDDDVYIELSESIQLSRAEDAEAHFAERERTFRSHWERELRRTLSEKTSHRTPWEAVARLLRRDLTRQIDDIKVEIEGLGKGENLLHSVPEGRDKENFFATKGVKLKNQLIAALERLTEYSRIESASDSEKPRFRQIGIMMLAERIASIAKHNQANEQTSQRRG